MGDGLWVPVAVPSVGVLCFRAWWEASSESLQVFGDASRLHDLKRPSLFRRDKVPARNTHKIVRLRLYEPKKVFEGSKGRFFKNAPWQGVGQRPAKRGKASQRGTPFQAGQGPFTKHRQTVRLRLHEPKKVFEGSKGRFLKTPPWQGVGQRPTKRIKQKTRPDRLKSQASLSSGFTGKDHSSFSSTTFLAQMISKFPLRQRRSLRKARSSF